MEKEQVFKMLDDAKSAGREIWIGVLASSKVPKEYKEIFRILNDYSYEINSLSVTREHDNVRTHFEFSTIFNIEEHKDSIMVEIYEDRA